MKVKVKETGEIYICEVCGNEVIVTKVGGGELVCCDEKMKLVKAGDENGEIEVEEDEGEE